MLIAQGSVNIDENAKLAQQAQQAGNDLANSTSKLRTLMDGLSTEAPYAPTADNDPNYHTHRYGDVWTQYNDVNGIHIAENMYVWDNGWQAKKWDMNQLSVKDFSSLNISSSQINSSQIYSANIVGGALALDLNGDGFSGMGYDGGFNPLRWDNNGNQFYGDNAWSMGMHAMNGLMTFRGHRSPGVIDAGNFDTTMIGPNDIKLRESTNTNTGDGDITDRVDIRSNYIQIASGYHELNPGAKNAKYKGVELASNGNVTATGTAYLGGLQVDEIDPYTGYNEIRIPHGIDTNYIKNPFWKDAHITFDSAIDCNYNVYANTLHGKGVQLSSDLTIKNVVKEFDSKQALSEVLGTDIYKYHYKGDNEQTNIGPVIDNVNDIKDAKYNTSEYMISRFDNGDTLALQNTIGLLIGSVHELSKQNEQLLGKITQLEVKANGNN